MPPPKDPEKLAAYREKMRQIALDRGYGKWMTGKTHTSTSRQKMSETQRRIGNDPAERARRSERAKALGYGRWMTGKTATVATKAKMSVSAAQSYEARYGERAETERAKRRQGNRDRWDGVPRKPQRPKHNGDWQYREWFQAVFQRDDYTCRACGVRGGALHAHHVKSWADYPDLRYEVGNGRTLHEKCHRAVHAGRMTTH